MTILDIPHFGLDRQYKNTKFEILEATDLVLKTGQLLDGHYTTKFENWLKNYTGCQYAITCHSGTQALEIIARFVFNNTAPGTTIRVPNISYPATINALTIAGWKIQLVDTDKNGIILPKNKINLDDRAMPMCTVGLYGAIPPDDFAPVIVDGAQHWLAAGDSCGIGMAISFDPTKNLPASGNGGAIVTNLYGMYDFARKYKNHGKSKFDTVGTNSKMSELDCAHLLVRTNYIGDWQSRREQIAQYYLEQFKDLPIRCLRDKKQKHANQKFVIYYNERNALSQHLLDNGIEVKIHYEKALSELGISNNMPKPDILSTSVLLTRGVLSLPIFPELSDNEVEYIAHKVQTFFN